MISVSALTKTFSTSAGHTLALDGVSFEVSRGQVYVLLGPSGCGKTTLLRCLAGIETAESGEIAIDGRTVFSSQHKTMVPAHRRGVGLVFQSYAIWPHMRVFDNVAYPLRYGAKRCSREEIRLRVMAALELLEMDHLASQSATALSGGQQQRVALARAIVHEPSVLLMDEPLSNLDARLRHQTRVQLAALLSQLGTTTVYVTHDKVEAMALADVVAVMRSGRIVQAAPPQELYDRPADAFVAGFIGEMNWLQGRVKSHEREQTLVETRAGVLCCAQRSEIAEGSEVLVGIRPLAIAVRAGTEPDPACTGASNVIEGEILRSMFLGESTTLTVKVGESELQVASTERDVQRRGHVRLRVSAQDCLVYPSSGQPANERGHLTNERRGTEHGD